MTGPIKLPNTKLFINNEWVDSQCKRTFNTVNPYTEEVICSVTEGDKEDVDIAVIAARKALEEGPWGSMSTSDRSALMMKLADLIEKNKDYLSKLESTDNGKPLSSASGYDLDQSIKTIRYYAGCADKIHGKSIQLSQDYTCYTRHEPIGVVGVITPWNFPLMIMCWKIGPALAAGCTIIAKQSEITPLTALALCELIKEAGFPPGVFNLIPGFGPTVGNAISHHMDIDAVSFTGSNRTGRLITEASAKSNLKKITLELGGKSPNIVFGDVDLDIAVKGARDALYPNSGQSCCAGSRLYVHESIYKEFLGKFVESVKSLKLGDPFDKSTDQGPVASKEHFDRVMSFIQRGKDEGAHVLLGGKRHGNKGFFVEPTIFTNVQESMAICKHEIFGPVICVIPFSDTKQLIHDCNNTEYSLAAGVWTNNLSTALNVANRLKAGSVWVNDYSVVDVRIPFGDHGGFGKDLSTYAVDQFIAIKALTINHKICK
ncbi:aldehyde dehydrogenase [Tieghemostelium lacteum]|uniref:Aldehyde dehydrogenase n=1 Tax=Tieghemostelium lacteum TaxID=361077 RepID=A0A152A3Q5_TIELA|nr:aldehyde dehydrogenase [Tieghemostelium lacteum]|eukprot:KYR00856.1 aldehyde dehydrogenase [Tieghemostelium lacteum]